MLSGFRNVSCPIQSHEFLGSSSWAPYPNYFFMSLVSSSLRSVIKHLGHLFGTSHTGRQCKEGSRGGGQELGTQELQEDREDKEGGKHIPCVFGRGMLFPPPGHLCGDMIG